MKKNNVITFRVCEKTQNMMDEELDWCKREKVPPYFVTFSHKLQKPLKKVPVRCKINAKKNAEDCVCLMMF